MLEMAAVRGVLVLAASGLSDAVITNRYVGDASAPVSSTVALIGGGLVAVVVSVVVLVTCAGKRDDTSRRESMDQLQMKKADSFVAEELNNARDNTVSMEANPLYEVKQKSNNLESRASIISPDDVDEDELANNEMSGSVMRARALTAERMKRPNDAAATAAPGISLGSVSSAVPLISFDSDEPTWLHNELKKGDSVNMLKSFPNKCDGLFLVRAKKADVGMYALDVLNEINGEYAVESYLVSRTTTGLFEVDGRLTKSGARSIEGVIAELRGSGNLICTPLTRELPRTEIASAGGRDLSGKAA